MHLARCRCVLWAELAVIEYDPPKRLVHEWQFRHKPEMAGEPESLD